MSKFLLYEIRNSGVRRLWNRSPMKFSVHSCGSRIEYFEYCDSKIAYVLAMKA